MRTIERTAWSPLCRLLAILMLLLACDVRATAWAQSDSEGPSVEAAPEEDRFARSNRPALRGHRFIPNPLTGEAFPRTEVQITMGVGEALDVELLPPTILSNGDTLQGLQGDIAVALLGFGYSYAIREWMEVGVGFGLTGRLGTDVGSLFSEGATVLTSFNLGWLFKILERESVYLSGDIVVRNSGFTGLQVGDWIDGIIEGTEVELVNSVPSLRTSAGLNVAYAVNDMWGITGSGHLGWGESVSTREANATTWQLAGAVDVDFMPRQKVPIGLSLAGEVTNSSVDGRPDVDDIIVGNLRIAYTGEEDFLIGADFNFSRLKPNASTTIAGDPKSTDSVKTGALTAFMKFYF